MIATAEVCDFGECPALVAVEVTLPTGHLKFCSHHYNQSADALVKAGATHREIA